MKELTMQGIVRFMLLGLVLGTGSAAAVETGLKPSDAEMLQLPDYCQAKYKLPQGSPEWKAWQSRIGQNFIDLHHYCAGLNFVNRFWGARSKQDKTFYLQRAMTNFDYMVKAEKPDFSLRVDLYSNRGEVFKLMGRPGEAIKDFNRALAIDPRIVRPYLQLADLHVAGKAPGRALETVSEGLRNVPDSSALQRRYLELGGKKPFPEPIIAKAAEPVVPQSESAGAALGADAAIEPILAPAQNVPPAAEAATQSESVPTIGTPKNPYCRFCPPE
jgi:tetratricopeptide (TPR) repeat protein